MHYQQTKPLRMQIGKCGYVVWRSFFDTPRYGAGVFATRAEAEAVIAHSYRRGEYVRGELEVRKAVFPPLFEQHDA